MVKTTFTSIGWGSFCRIFCQKNRLSLFPFKHRRLMHWKKWNTSLYCVFYIYIMLDSLFKFLIESSSCDICIETVSIFVKGGKHCLSPRPSTPPCLVTVKPYGCERNTLEIEHLLACWSWDKTGKYEHLQHGSLSNWIGHLNLITEALKLSCGGGVSQAYSC